MSARRHQVMHVRRKITGRPMVIAKDARTVRELLRRHLREEGMRLMDLAPAWGRSAHTVYSLFAVDRPLAPEHLEASIQALGLDEFDANELRLQGAREAGWQIDPTFLLEKHA